MAELSIDQQKQLLSKRRDTIIRELAAMNMTTIGGKVDSVGPGTHLRNQSHREGLLRELDAIRQQLIYLDGPVAIEHQGIP